MEAYHLLSLWVFQEIASTSHNIVAHGFCDQPTSGVTATESLSWSNNRQTEGAAKLAANPAGEGPASRSCPVATVDIPDGGASDLSFRGSGVNVPAGKARAASGPSGGLASQQAVAKGANR